MMVSMWVVNRECNGMGMVKMGMCAKLVEI